MLGIHWKFEISVSKICFPLISSLSSLVSLQRFGLREWVLPLSLATTTKIWVQLSPKVLLFSCCTLTVTHLYLCFFLVFYAVAFFRELLLCFRCVLVVTNALELASLLDNKSRYENAIKRVCCWRSTGIVFAVTAFLDKTESETKQMQPNCHSVRVHLCGPASLRRCSLSVVNPWILSLTQLFDQYDNLYLNPAQVTSKHKHRCCPCPKWADFVCSLILD